MGIDGKVKETVTEYIYPPDLLDNYVNAIINAITGLQNLEIELMEKYGKRAKRDLKMLFDMVIDDFYDDYPVKVYKRKEWLYKIYKITINGWGWIVDVSSDYLPSHHQDNEIIYNNVFIEGYHGGSRGTDKNGVSVSTPTWRWPVKNISGIPRFSRWYSHPAPQSDSPDQKIEEEYEKYKEEKYAQALSEFDEKGMKYIEPIISAEKLLFG